MYSSHLIPLCCGPRSLSLSTSTRRQRRSSETRRGSSVCSRRRSARNPRSSWRSGLCAMPRREKRRSWLRCRYAFMPAPSDPPFRGEIRVKRCRTTYGFFRGTIPFRSRFRFEPRFIPMIWPTRGRRLLPRAKLAHIRASFVGSAPTENIGLSSIKVSCRRMAAPRKFLARCWT